MPYHPDKDSIRTEVDTRLNLLTRQDIREKSSRLFSRFREEFLKPGNNCTQLLSFISMPVEVQTDSFLQWAYTSQLQVALPRIEKGSASMQFHLLEEQDIPAGLERHPFGFLQPKQAFPLLKVEALTKDRALMLVPGAAFTAGGKRLGRGGGYYDRFLRFWGAHVTAVGICFSEQLYTDLPMEAHDMYVDRIITD